MNTFNRAGEFVCDCGKQFTSLQSFNGHKCHCETHQIVKHGSLEYKNIKNQQRREARIRKQKQRTAEKHNLKDALWLSKPHFCETCGQQIVVKYGSGRFCSPSCAHSHAHSQEVKQKISSSLAHFYGGTSKYQTAARFCSHCGQPISKYGKSGLCATCIKSADFRKDIRSLASKKGYQTRIANGTFQGWRSRNQTSFAESFWMKVLDSNQISYQHNSPVKKADGKNNYFLDFLISVKDTQLDLEIDGKQHHYPDQIQSDQRRDVYLKSLGYVVYRVDWNEISSEIGASQMKSKIDDFLKYYQQLIESQK